MKSMRKIEARNAEWEERKRNDLEEMRTEGSAAGAIITASGATMNKAYQNFRKLFGADDAQEKLDEIEKNEEILKTRQPAAVFGEPLVQGLTAIGSMGLGTIPSLMARVPAAMTLGAAEMVGFAPSDEEGLKGRGGSWRVYRACV